MLELKIGEAAPPDTFSNWVSIVQHVSDVLVAFAWPSALIGLALLFRREIVALLGRLQSADVAGAKMEFGEKVGIVQRQMPDLAEKILDRVQPPEEGLHADENEPTHADSTSQDDLLERNRNNSALELFKQVENVSEQPPDLSGSLTEDPVRRIETSWSKLERAIDDLFFKRLPNNLSTGISHKLWKLVDTGHIPSQLANTVQELQSIRNQMAHSPNAVIGAAEAAEFSRSATQMRQMLELLAAPSTRLKGRN